MVTTASIAAEAKKLADAAHDQIVANVVSNLVENGSFQIKSIKSDLHSIPATEHSVMTKYMEKSSKWASCLGENLWGELVNDLKYEKIFTKLKRR